MTFSGKAPFRFCGFAVWRRTAVCQIHNSSAHDVEDFWRSGLDLGIFRRSETVTESLLEHVEHYFHQLEDESCDKDDSNFTTASDIGSYL